MSIRFRANDCLQTVFEMEFSFWFRVFCLTICMAIERERKINGLKKKIVPQFGIGTPGCKYFFSPFTPIRLGRERITSKTKSLRAFVLVIEPASASAQRTENYRRTIRPLCKVNKQRLSMCTANNNVSHFPWNALKKPNTTCLPKEYV